ncbi:GNAT family N-acetyltransferase [Fictibacillus sp. b24]|uniref:GNAT family N-acetyltransferase n=1 Tax=Fictibacillus sp. b24 TaxID=3055863 RepID=UPI0025A01383|nr:GNAT family N-acetyltransferase [Fictibacillus sp. b24]MDM5314538.1 GNAT family N-acetyltransferase [Fictibacillus sp. b24]
MESKIVYKILELTDLGDNLLDSFKRYQETKNVWYLEEDELKTKDDYFIDDWSADKKKLVIDELRLCVTNNGIVAGAFDGEKLVGFASVESERFGSKNQYVELPYIHVSSEARGLGIGKKLFEICCKESKKLGAEKLYIAAHPSIESQAFYDAVGCKRASEINVDVLKKEPLDIQLEKIL